MAYRFITPLQRSVCVAALAVALLAAPEVVHAAQITGADALNEATPHQRAIRVLREMQRDSVKVDGRHWQAAQRCDRAAMEAYLRQLNELAAQARNVIRNAGLENDTSSNAITADQIAENIEMRAKHAASRQPKNCGGAGAQEGTGGTGTTGTPGGQTGSTPQQPPPPTPAPRDAAEEQRELARQQEAVQEAEAEIERIRRFAREGRCMAALHAANELEEWIHDLINPPRVRMGDLLLPPPPPPQIPPDVIQDWLRRIAEALQECPEPQQQGTGTGATGTSNTAGSPQQQETAPQPPPPPPQTPRFNSGSPLDGIRNRAWSAMEEITDAYEQCDPERFERALNELEQMRRDAKAAADAARAAPEFRTVTPEEAQNLADELQRQIDQRRYILDGLKRSCGNQHRPGGTGTLLGPRRPDSTGAQQPEQKSPQTEPQPNTPNLLDMFAGSGTRERSPQDSGAPSDNRGVSGGDERQQQSGGNTPQANEPKSEVRTRPQRDRQKDRCDKPEGERPADCPNR